MLKCEAYIVRFADDFVYMFEYEEEAKAVYEHLKIRLAKFGLELAEDKSRILPFGRNSVTTDTFDFLGFTHVNGKTRNGKYTVGHKISKKIFKAKLKKWIKDNRNTDINKFMAMLNRKLIGTNNYYCISSTFNEVRGKVLSLKSSVKFGMKRLEDHMSM